MASAEGLVGVDVSHCDAPGGRTLGARYAEALIDALGQAPQCAPSPQTPCPVACFEATATTQRLRVRYP